MSASQRSRGGGGFLAFAVKKSPCSPVSVSTTTPDSSRDASEIPPQRSSTPSPAHSTSTPMCASTCSASPVWPRHRALRYGRPSTIRSGNCSHPGRIPPAFIINRQLDVLAYNDLAGALYSGFERIDNIARMVFLDPFGRSFFTDRDRATTSCVANLRLALGHTGSADDVRALVLQAHAASAEFRELWSRHDVRGKTHEAKEFRHPAVGDLLLEYNAFDVRSAPGHQLIVYQAPVGSPSADKLQLLGSLAATASSDLP